METKQIVLLLGLIAAFIFIYVMHVGTACPVQPYTTERADDLHR